ncbi:MAG: hypothetical protein RL199_1090 [Pseudomonadota bacterium]|jgi:L-threonylcarbamoyladenylate synthase
MPPILPAFRPDGSLDAATVARAASLMARGGLVAFPTETVYGLGANALDADAVRRIFAAKGRPSFNPLIVHVTDVVDARKLSSAWPEVAERLAEAFWPGPLTLVVPRASVVPDVVTGGLDSVALRVPAHPVARALMAAAGVPVAAPSANPYRCVSPTLASHVASSLGDRVDLVVDGGACEVGLESTVLDLSGPVPLLLRPGGVSAEAIRRVVGVLEEPHLVQDEGARVSPGLLSKHYAPAGLAQLVPASELADRIDALPPDARVGVLARLAARPTSGRVTAWCALPETPEAYARALFASLHEVDAAGCTHVLIETLPDEPEWAAPRDRVVRAAG